MPDQSAPGQSNPSSSSSNKTILIIVVVAIILLVLGGIYFLSQKSSEKAAEQAIENATGADVDIDGDKTTIETDEGKITVGSGSEVPDSFPSDVTVYKDAEVIGSTETEDGVTLTLTTSDSVAAATDFYTKDTKDKGWKISSSSNFESSSLITAEKGDKSLLITISPDKSSGKTSIVLIVSTVSN